MLVIKIASNIFLTSAYVCPLPQSPPSLQQDIYYVKVCVCVCVCVCVEKLETITVKTFYSGHHRNLKIVSVIEM